MNREKKFTPGPWMWNGAAGVTEEKGEPRNRIRVCDVWNSKNGCYLNHPDYIVKANASLIAAVPELLEYAEDKCNTCFSEHQSGYYDMSNKDIREEFCSICPLNKIISKAYGETHD